MYWVMQQGFYLLSYSNMHDISVNYTLFDANRVAHVFVSVGGMDL